MLKNYGTEIRNTEHIKGERQLIFHVSFMDFHGGNQLDDLLESGISVDENGRAIYIDEESGVITPLSDSASLTKEEYKKIKKDGSGALRHNYSDYKKEMRFLKDVSNSRPDIGYIRFAAMTHFHIQNYTQKTKHQPERTKDLRAKLSEALVKKHVETVKISPPFDIDEFIDECIKEIYDNKRRLYERTPTEHGFWINYIRIE